MHLLFSTFICNKYEKRAKTPAHRSDFNGAMRTSAHSFIALAGDQVK
jgi:hypothetical protein